MMKELLFINKEKIASLFPMNECIEVMEEMFRSLANGECVQPLRSLMRLPEQKGILGMMPGHSESLGVSGIKVITVFHNNRNEGLPSHQGVVILFDGKNGEPLMMFDGSEITAIRTAAASAVATNLLAKKNAETLAIVGAGEQAKQHIDAILLVRKIKQINIWNRSKENAEQLAKRTFEKYKTSVSVKNNVEEAVMNADIICTTTSSKEPIVMGEWIREGAHINAVGSSVAIARELDTNAVVKSKLFTDRYESIFNEGGDFLIPKKEGLIDEAHVKAEVGEVLTGKKKGRENDNEITLFKSLGIAAEDIFSAHHIYKKIKQSE